MLVIRSSKGAIRWMDVSAYLKRETERHGKPPKQVIFDGEPFTVETIRLMGRRVLATAR